MKFVVATVALLAAAPAYAQMDPAVPGMAADHQAAQSSRPATAEAVGQIRSVDAKAGTITLRHGRIAALGWPAMTMTFKAAPEVLDAARPGQTVRFTLETADDRVLAIQPQ